MRKVNLIQCSCGKIFDSNGFLNEASRTEGVCKTCVSKADTEYKKGKPKSCGNKDSLEYLAEYVE